jgi:molecular chaperone GrpE
MTDNTTSKQEFNSQEVPQQEETLSVQEKVNYKDLYVHLTADLQNFKRRIEKERLEWSETAQGFVISTLLPIFEDFDRAIELAGQLSSDSSAANREASHIEGFKLIQKNIKKALVDLGVNEIEATGEFNPEYHEALAHIDSPAHTSGNIAQVFSKGYMFKGKVLKHAQVGVAK